jgi:hypothetical protein
MVDQGDVNPDASQRQAQWHCKRRGSTESWAMSRKSREVICGGRIVGANIHAKAARESAKKAIREADSAEADARSVRMEGYGGPAQPSPTIAQCLNGGLGWPEVECNLRRG